MNLQDLMPAIDATAVLPAGPAAEITSLHYRAQEVRPGGLFVAIPGSAADGHDFIPTAVKQGARAVVAERPVDCGVTTIQVPDSRGALARLAARFYGAPARDLKIIGVTGTSGKTTVTYLLEQILIQAGFPVGVIGTVNCRWGGETRPSPVTTPESLDLQQILAQMHTEGVTHVVMEISSHGVAQQRIAACYMDAGIFTNLSQDHLDYHATMDAYWATKKQLFTRYLANGPKAHQAAAVVNTDNPYGMELAQTLNSNGTPRCFTCGSDPASDIRVQCDRMDLTGLAGKITTPRGEVAFKSALVGTFNQENIANAVGAAEALQIPLPAMAAGIAALGCVPGRLELVPSPQGPRAYVDYAHKPGALEHVLATLKPFTTGRLIAVFGCGGDRDREKRPIMGAIAARHADLAIVTSDNPRTEDPMGIITDILPGVRQVQERAYELDRMSVDWTAAGYAVEPDRRKAIRAAVGIARPDDVILVAGKGHETYQIIGTERIEFDDCREVAQALARGGS